MPEVKARAVGDGFDGDGDEGGMRGVRPLPGIGVRGVAGGHPAARDRAVVEVDGEVAARAQVTVRGTAVALTSHEYRLLAYLMHHPGRVVSRQALTEHIYAQDCDRDSNTLEVFVARLRRKLGASVIETVRGLGYRVTGGAEQESGA